MYILVNACKNGFPLFIKVLIFILKNNIKNFFLFLLNNKKKRKYFHFTQSNMA